MGHPNGGPRLALLGLLRAGLHVTDPLKTHRRQYLHKSHVIGVTMTKWEQGYNMSQVGTRVGTTFMQVTGAHQGFLEKGGGWKW